MQLCRGLGLSRTRINDHIHSQRCTIYKSHWTSLGKIMHGRDMEFTSLGACMPALPWLCTYGSQMVHQNRAHLAFFFPSPVAAFSLQSRTKRVELLKIISTVKIWSKYPLIISTCSYYDCHIYIILYKPSSWKLHILVEQSVLGSLAHFIMTHLAIGIEQFSPICYATIQKYSFDWIGPS